MIRAHFLILRARPPVRHARRPVLHFSARVGVASVRVRRVGVRVSSFFARGQGVRLRMIRAHFLIFRARFSVRHFSAWVGVAFIRVLRARRPVCRVGVRMGVFFVRSQGIRLRMIRARFLILCARFPVRHARFPVLHFSAREGVVSVRVLRARRPVCRVWTRVGGFFARGQGIRLRMIRAHFLILRARFPVRHACLPVLRARCPVCYACARVRGGRTSVRVEGLRGCAEDGGGSGTRGSIALGRGGRNGMGVALERLLVSIRRRIVPLPLTDDGRGGVVRAGPFSTLGKGDYRGMGFFILFFSILFSSGGVRIGERGRDVLLLGSRVFALGGCGVGVGSFVFHFRGFGLGSDRSGGKIARGVRLLGGFGVPFRGLGFALGGCDFIFARCR